MTPSVEPDVFRSRRARRTRLLDVPGIDAWSDPYATWRSAVIAGHRRRAGRRRPRQRHRDRCRRADPRIDLVPEESRARLDEAIAALRSPRRRIEEPGRPGTGDDIADLLGRYPVRELVTKSRTYRVGGPPPRAVRLLVRVLPPRSTGGWDTEGNPAHGTFLTAVNDLPRIAGMGF